ncbi:MAG: NADH-quinone oxidoreductase subunit J [Cuniculiplasma sp.]
MIFTIITLIFAIIMIILAAIAVEQKDIMRSIIFLMAFLFVLSANFIFLGATLIGAIELLVYVGAVSALLVFTMMITGGKEIE